VVVAEPVNRMLDKWLVLRRERLKRISAGGIDTATVRIMHVVDSLGRGGLENGLVNLIARLDPRRFRHIVLALRRLGPAADLLPLDRAEVLCLNSEGINSRFQATTLVRAIRAIRPDIVHSRNWGGIEAVIAGRIAGACALVHSEHGLEAAASVKEPWRRIWYRRLAYEMADRVLSVSRQLRQFHCDRTGFPDHKFHVIHNGVDTRRFVADPQSRRRIRDELGISDQDFCIGSVGNLLPVKDHLTMLRAFDELLKSGGNWRVLLVGEGPERQTLESFLDARPELHRRVSFIGSSNRVPELLRALDIYVLPSLNEGISNSLLEAMASGLPVVVTAVGGNSEVVIEGESGLLFPVGNYRQLAKHIAILLANSELRQRLGTQAAQRMRDEFSIESMVRNYERLYTDLGHSLALKNAMAVL
jgi:sugar transferase (PEP-CTERM/EpsH1 system associated)